MIDIEGKVKQTIAEQLCVDVSKVTAESTLDALGADSLDRIELVMMIEEQFDIEIPDEDAETITTVQQAVDYVKRKKA